MRRVILLIALLVAGCARIPPPIRQPPTALDLSGMWLVEREFSYAVGEGRDAVEHDGMRPVIAAPVPGLRDPSGYDSDHDICRRDVSVPVEWKSQDLILELGHLRGDWDVSWNDGWFDARTLHVSPEASVAIPIPASSVHFDRPNSLRVTVTGYREPRGFDGGPVFLRLASAPASPPPREPLPNNLHPEAIPLAGTWSVHFVDERLDDMWFLTERLRMGDLDTSGWPQTDLPDIHRAPGLHPEHASMTWFARRVAVPESWAGRALRLQLGGLRGRGDVFFNREQIGEVPEDVQIDAIIPEWLVRPGQENVISVEVFAETPATGITEGPFTLSPITGEPDAPAP